MSEVPTESHSEVHTVTTPVEPTRSEEHNAGDEPQPWQPHEQTPAETWQAQEARQQAADRASTPATEAPASQGTVPESRVQEMIDQALARQREEHNSQMDNLRSEVASATRTPIGFTPQHAGGADTNIADSWGKADQELAQRGEHPSQKSDSQE